MKVGAYYYMLKPVRADEINQILIHAKLEIEISVRKFF